MKKLVVFAFGLVLFACNSVEQYRGSIESLASQWDEATTSVNDLASQVAQEKTSWAQMVSSMTLEESTVEALPEDAKTQIMEAESAFQNSGQGFDKLSTEVNDFVTNWQEKSAELTTLRDGLAEGKLSSDASTQIADLTTMVSDATANISAWKEKLETIKSDVSSTHKNWSDLVAQLMPVK
ncbi:MAG: hypothetical protein KDC57_10740 [Saprospiraceae bacterium]|nr:hypothetical protein [Saprospiraceae bacterium]